MFPPPSPRNYNVAVPFPQGSNVNPPSFFTPGNSQATAPGSNIQPPNPGTLDLRVSSWLHQQGCNEIFNSLSYFQLGAALVHEGWMGSAKFMFQSAHEELKHAQKFAEYLTEHDADFIVGGTKLPEGVGNLLPQSAFQAALILENWTTANIQTMQDQVIEAGDMETAEFLDWFVNEQSDSEKEINEILDQIKGVSMDPEAMDSCDQMIGQKAVE